MSAELLSSKVVVVEEEPRVRGIPTLPTAVVGAVGLAERGPIGKPVLCTSFEEYQSVFGGFTRDAELPVAAMGFFENGGSRLWVVRSVHYNNIHDRDSYTAVHAEGVIGTMGGVPTRAEVSSWKDDLDEWVEDGDTLIVIVDGGAPQTFTISAHTPWVESNASFPTGFSGGETLIVSSMGQVRTITFQAGDQTVEQVAQRINEGLIVASASVTPGGQIRITADLGGWEMELQVQGGSANSVLQFSETLMPGSGNVAFTGGVGSREIRDLINDTIVDAEAFRHPDGRLGIRTFSSGSSASIEVHASSTLAARFGFPTTPFFGDDTSSMDMIRVEARDAGAFANAFEIEIRNATTGHPDEFDLHVIDDGAHRESFANLSMDSGRPRYFRTIINDERQGSRFIHVQDLHVTALPPPPQTAGLFGGNDGLLGLNEGDAIGSPVGKTGMYALDFIADLSLLIMPGLATPAIHNAMVNYCENVRGGSVFAILDPPEEARATEMVDYVANTASLEGLSEFAAIYWPRVEILNPSRSVYGIQDKIDAAPSGIIAGVYSRTDAARPGGVYDPPAGIEKGRMFGVVGFDNPEALDEKKRDLVYPKRINPLTTGPGLPRFIDGSRTLKGDGNFPYIAERRGVSFIAASLKQGLQFARHKNNTEALRAQVRRTITAFLLTQMNNGAFRSREPDKAFFVDVSDALNTPSVIFAGKLVARVGLATNKPAEFIILSISQDTRALETELAG